MFKPFLKIWITIFLLYIQPFPTEGLQCYHCEFSLGIFFGKNQTSGKPFCESEMQPVDCETYHVGTNVTDQTFSCLTVIINGQLKSESETKGNFTIRTCLVHPLESESRPVRNSYYNSSSEIGTGLQEVEVRKLFTELLHDFKDSAEAEAWVCDENNCNGVEQVREIVSIVPNIGEEALVEQDAKNVGVFQSLPPKPLKCNACGHHGSLQSSEEDLMEAPCATGKESKPDFSANCADLDYWGKYTPGVFTGFPKGSQGQEAANLTNIFTKFQATYSCITYSVDGEITYSGSRVKDTVRSCAIFIGANGLDKCYEEEVSQLQDVVKEPWLKSLTSQFSSGFFTADTNVGICSCFFDGCNGVNISSTTTSNTALQIVFGIQNMYSFLLNSW